MIGTSIMKELIYKRNLEVIPKDKEAILHKMKQINYLLR